MTSVFINKRGPFLFCSFPILKYELNYAKIHIKLEKKWQKADCDTPCEWQEKDSLPPWRTVCQINLQSLVLTFQTSINVSQYLNFLQVHYSTCISSRTPHIHACMEYWDSVQKSHKYTNYGCCSIIILRAHQCVTNSQTANKLERLQLTCQYPTLLQPNCVCILILAPPVNETFR